ncbi:MAG: M1 family metallopeptidase, partial [Gammaproteobacteria bacterium]
MADTQERGSVPDPTAYKLPAVARPERYALRLTPELAAFTFTGEEVIAITIREPLDEIVLNAIELAIHSTAITSAQGKRYTGTVSLDEAHERATLRFSTVLEPGAWTLHLTFSGTLNDKLHGFYRSRYRDASGQEKVLACTQFESTDARRAFPCWDEPAFKAVFQTTLIVDEGLTAISNSRIVRETALAGSGKKEVVFADSIKMSTYLVAFIVGELEATAPTFVGGKPLRIWAVPGKRHLAKFAQAIGAASLAFFSRYYGLEYPG